MKLEFASPQTLLAALLLGAAGVASAQSSDIEPGFYAGALAGWANYPGRPLIIVGSSTLFSQDTHEHDVSWGFVGGYRFGRHFAIEAGYRDLGEARADLADAANTTRAKLRFSARGATVAAVGLFPFGPRWEMFVKGGALYQNVDFHLDGTQSGVPFALSSSLRNDDTLYLEGGASYRFDSHLKANLGLSYFPNIGKRGKTGEAEVRSTFLGISYQF